MTDKVQSEILKATSVARIVAQAVDDNSKAAHPMHSDVTKPIHRVNDAGMQTHTVSGDTKTSHSKAFPETKDSNQARYKVAGVTNKTASHNPKTDTHTLAPDVNVSGTGGRTSIE